MQTAIKEIKTDRSQYQILFTPDGFEPDFPAAPEGEAEKIPGRTLGVCLNGSICLHGYLICVIF